MDWAVTARTTVPHVRSVDADRELATWVLVDAHAEHGLRHRRDREAGARRGGGRRGRLPHRRRRQPARRARASAPDGRAAVPGPHRPDPPARPAAHPARRARGRAGGSDARPLGRRDRRRCAGRRAGAVWSWWSRDFLDGSTRTGSARPPDWERPLRRLAARHQVLAVRSPTRASWSCRTSGCSRWSTRRPAGGARCRPASRRLRERYAAAAARPAADRSRRRCAGPAPPTFHCGPTGTGSPTSSGTCTPSAGSRVAAPATARRCRMTLESPAAAVAAGRRRGARRRVRRAAAAAQQVRGAVHQPEAAGPGRAEAARPGAGTCRPSLFLAMLALLVVGFARPADEVQVPRERATVHRRGGRVPLDAGHRRGTRTGSPPRRTRPASSSTSLPEQFNVGLVGVRRQRVGVRAAGDRPGAPSRPASTGSPRARPGGPARRSATPSPPSLRVDPHARRRGRRGRRRRPGWCVLSDGANTSGRDPDEAAGAAAAELGVPVDAISFGTAEPARSPAAAGSRCRSTARRCSRSPRPTGGSYYEAGSADELQRGVRRHRQLGRLRDRAAGRLGPVHRHRPGARGCWPRPASMFWFARLP